MLPVFPYHQSATDYFRRQPAVWDFFAAQQHKAEQLSAFKADLLRNTYQFTETAEPAFFQQLAFAKEKLQLSLPVYMYQAENSTEANASIVYLNGEAHIVFSGNLLERLNDDERLAIIAHELSHILLYTEMEGAVEVTHRIVSALEGHAFSTPAHGETARLFRLYTELYCDRGAYVVTGNYAPVVTALVKLATGLGAVSADNYIRQAEEIFSLDQSTRSAGLTHPENFIRARALWLWHQQGEAALPAIQQMVDSFQHLDELDLFKQQALASATRRLIGLLLDDQRLQTAHTLALAKQYFGDFEPAAALPVGSHPSGATRRVELAAMPASIREYFAYVLYDFATADRSLDDLPLARCFQLADEAGITEAFGQVVKKERKLTDKKLAALQKSIGAMTSVASPQKTNL